MIHPLAWSLENEEKLQQLYHQGYAISMMMTKLDMTKNKIVGKLHRMGLRGAPNLTSTDNQTTFPHMILNLQLPPKDWSPS